VVADRRAIFIEYVPPGLNDVAPHLTRGRVYGVGTLDARPGTRGKPVNPLAQARDWTGRLVEQNFRYFAGGAAVLVLTALAHTLPQSPSANDYRESGGAAAEALRLRQQVQQWRYGAGTDLSAARPIDAAERTLSGAVASVDSALLDTLQRSQGTPAFELVDDNVLDPIVRHLSRSAIAKGETGTRLTGLIAKKTDGQLVIETPDGVVHEIIGAQDRTGANDPALLDALSSLVGKRATVTGFLDPLDPLPAKDFVAWSLLGSTPSAQTTTETVGVIGAFHESR